MHEAEEPIFHVPSLAKVQQKERLESQIELEVPSIDDVEPREEYEAREIVIEPKTGLPRQAGASMPEGKYISRFKKAAEERLFVFSKAVMGRDYLTQGLHLPVCDFVQQSPPHRKLILMPREHAKTSIISHCYPAHILIQPADGNIYFPGIEGSECRILLAGETADMAKKNLRVVRAAFVRNSLLRALWPQRCWEGNPKRHGAMWSDWAMELPRETDWPDPSIRAIGVDGAITGSRPNVLIKDDLVSLKAANSEAEMESAIEWHKASRALLEEYEKESGLFSLETIIGTRWSVHDLYSYIVKEDPTVEQIDKRFHRIITDGKILWPERITEKFIEQKMREYGSLYYLLYLNSAADPNLIDFDMELIRTFALSKGEIRFNEDQRDAYLIEKLKGKEHVEEQRSAPRGIPFNSGTYDTIVGSKGRGAYFRFKYG